MMKLKSLLIGIFLLCGKSLLGVQQIATIDGQSTPIPGMIVTIPVSLVIDSLPYQTGGTVFTFPADTFTQNPTPYITLEWTAYTPSFVHSAYVTAITPTSLTVNVNKIDASGTIQEADSNEVNVTILVSGT